MNLKNAKTNICYVHLMGGLGNQLFQIAAGLKISLECQSELIIDDSFGNYRKNFAGKADILTFNTDFKSTKVSKPYIKGFLARGLSLLIRISLKSENRLFHTLARNFLRRLTSYILTFKFGQHIQVWSATNLGFEQIPKYKSSTYLIGYFQTFKFASQIDIKTILNKMSIEHESINEYKTIALKETPLIVHIRLGDYLTESKFGIPSVQYYETAISVMMAEFNYKHIWVFSDDIDKAKLFIPKNYFSLCRWIDDKNDPAALTLEKMRLGSGYIIGNSTFSWWGAFLSYTSNSPTIAPSPWFIGMDDPNELIPPNWRLISRYGDK